MSRRATPGAPTECTQPVVTQQQSPSEGQIVPQVELDAAAAADCCVSERSRCASLTLQSDAVPPSLTPPPPSLLSSPDWPLVGATVNLFFFCNSVLMYE